MDTFFRFGERGTNFRTEILAGVTTFMTMAYIIFVNPGILSAMFGEAAGEWIPALTTATALGAALMCIAMGLISNRPLALASGMGLNAVVAFSIVLGAGVPWQVGMSVVFVEGVIIFLLVMTGLREAIMDAIPLDLKRAIGVGIGLFISFIGLKSGGLVVANDVTLLSLGDFAQPAVWVTLIGLVAIFTFMALKVKGSILWASSSPPLRPSSSRSHHCPPASWLHSTSARSLRRSRRPKARARSHSCRSSPRRCCCSCSRSC